MQDLETRSCTDNHNGWWQQRTALEKVGATAVAVLGVVVVGVFLFPQIAAAAAGGALTATGAALLKDGFAR
jgi:hypothetical protein